MMHLPPHRSHRDVLTFTALSAAVVAAGARGFFLIQAATPSLTLHPGPMLLAPMIGVNDSCLQLPHQALATLNPAGEPTLKSQCTGPNGSASALIESTLSQLAPHKQEDAPFELGYTLAIPLMQLFKPAPSGWQINTERVERVARTVQQSSRPAILYFFSTHFSSNAPMEEALSRDPTNLAQTRDGPLRTANYYGAPVYNWSVARTDNSITQKRAQAINAVVDAICKLPLPERNRIRGVTLLGELHQMVPHFETGMGYEGPYRITDYSRVSTQGFQAYLKSQFGTLAQFNRAMGSSYTKFGDVLPPSRNIRSEPLDRYTEHIDAFAHGTLPIGGWAFLPQKRGSPPPWVHVYLDGTLLGRTRADRSRQDVQSALPELDSSDTGWSMDVDFRNVVPGLHRVDVLLEQQPGVFTSIGSRQIAIMDAHQRAPIVQAQKPLPATVPPLNGLRAHVDQPEELASYYFNPLVPWWHAFRNQQVAAYLGHFGALLEHSCLRDIPRFTHQILPFNAPGRDPNKLAVDASLAMSPRLYPGVSLYGDNVYGNTFRHWQSGHGLHAYGIAEFHPMKPMSALTLAQTFRRHATSGAQFLSFFLEPRWNGALVPRTAHNPFSFDPDNAEFGSDVLYRSVQQVLKGQAN